MRQPKLPWTGGCRCDRVRFEITEAPLITGACHCTGCQRMTASAFSLSVAVPTSGFRVAKGESERGGLQTEAHHMHRSFCKSWIYTNLPGMDDFVNVRATMLDERSWFTPYIETYTSEKLSWVSTPAKHSFEKFPDLADWPKLIAEYQRNSAVP